jgi:hypothetical protein
MRNKGLRSDCVGWSTLIVVGTFGLKYGRGIESLGVAIGSEVCVVREVP